MRIILYVFLFVVFALAQQKTPILVESDQLTYEKDKLIYTGHVKVTRGNGVLTADKVIVFLDENKKAKYIVAEGNVHYVEGIRRAKADRAEYDLQKEIVKLIGNARVEEGQNFVEGDQIVYYKKEDRAVAEGKGRKVRTFYIEKEGR